MGLLTDTACVVVLRLEFYARLFSTDNNNNIIIFVNKFRVKGLEPQQLV